MTPNASIATDASQPRYAAGAVIGNKYVLEGPLGEGGMATVWRARNLLLGSRVALKLLQPQLRSRDAMNRLLREARIEATLRHPGIIRVFDFDQTEHGDFFIVMELLEGQTLAELLEQRGKIEAAEAVRLLLPVVDALCAAHASGVVHRDLKPAHIMLARVGQHVRPKLVDFGIAKVALPEADLPLTGGAMLLGSPGYMAPEQAGGLEEKVDHRVDVWGVCVVLYEAVSGRAAFDGPSDDALLRAVVENEVAPFDEASIEHAALWPIVARGLAKAPALRFDSMLELGTVLAHWLLTHGTTGDRSEAEVARSWLRAHALSDRMYGPKRVFGLEGRPSPLWDLQPFAISTAAALSATELRCEPARRPRGRGAALIVRAAIVALLVSANASVGNRETESRWQRQPEREPVRGVRSAERASGVDMLFPASGVRRCSSQGDRITVGSKD